MLPSPPMMIMNRMLNERMRSNASVSALPT